MNFSENISYKLTCAITSQLDYDEEKKEIIAYAIETVLLGILGMVIIVLLGYALNVLVPTLLTACFGTFLRRLSGGAHLKKPLNCLVFGAIAYSFIGIIVGKLKGCDLSKMNLTMVLLIALLIVFFLAPVDSEAKPIHSKSLKLKLKVSSVIFVMVSILIVGFSANEVLSLSVTFGVLSQSITLLPIFNN
ncbi:accessory gene regulator ArgB-like protein [Candidatus Desulfosporosinus nitrosoreducens]|uniref:accessory gene regulator ArgB-like protein n=1 Tax=Candidatus Desulfosporosinus nitrosoreducens TaxID=3401928 RepID=UPI00280B9A3E|nr:accessory gene regulator B family protein [Desulfosporosinus sp. PR]